MIKPQNVVPVLKDKVITLWSDWSSGLTNSGKPIFFHPDTNYQVVAVNVLHSVAYIANQAVTISVGTSDGPGGSGSATKFVNAVSLGTAAIASGATTSLPLSNTVVLPAGTGLVVTNASSGSQTGEGVIQVILRPQEKVHGNASKRPGAAAQASA